MNTAAFRSSSHIHQVQHNPFNYHLTWLWTSHNINKRVNVWPRSDLLCQADDYRQTLKDHDVNALIYFLMELHRSAWGENHWAGLFIQSMMITDRFWFSLHTWCLKLHLFITLHHITCDLPLEIHTLGENKNC